MKYLIYEKHGMECEPYIAERGWVDVRALIDAGSKPVFRKTFSELRANELKEEILWARAHKEGRHYVKKVGTTGRPHSTGTVAGAHHVA